jgi:hypothetical protein
MRIIRMIKRKIAEFKETNPITFNNIILMLIILLFVIDFFAQSISSYLINEFRNSRSFNIELEKLGLKQSYTIAIMYRLQLQRSYYIIGSFAFFIFFLFILYISHNKLRIHFNNESHKISNILWIFGILVTLIPYVITLNWKNFEERRIITPLLNNHCHIEFFICDTPKSTNVLQPYADSLFSEYKENINTLKEANPILKKIAIFHFDGSYCDTIWHSGKLNKESFKVNVRTEVVNIGEKSYSNKDDIYFVQKINSENLRLISFLALGGNEVKFDSIPLSEFPNLCIGDIAVMPYFTWGLAQLTLGKFDVAQDAYDSIFTSNQKFMLNENLDENLLDRFKCSNAELYYLKAVTFFAEAIKNEQNSRDRRDHFLASLKSLNQAIEQLNTVKDPSQVGDPYLTINWVTANYREYIYICTKINLLIELYLSEENILLRFPLDNACKELNGKVKNHDIICNYATELGDLVKKRLDLQPFDEEEHPKYDIHRLDIIGNDIVLSK